jgi:hypothetical protein
MAKHERETQRVKSGDCDWSPLFRDGLPLRFPEAVKRLTNESVRNRMEGLMSVLGWMVPGFISAIPHSKGISIRYVRPESILCLSTAERLDSATVLSALVPDDATEITLPLSRIRLDLYDEDPDRWMDRLVQAELDRVQLHSVWEEWSAKQNREILDLGIDRSLRLLGPVLGQTNASYWNLTRRRRSCSTGCGA